MQTPLVVLLAMVMALQLTAAGCAKMHPNVEPRRRP